MKSANPSANTNNGTVPQRDNSWKPQKVGKTPLLAQLGRPIVWVARGLAWLTEPEESKGRGKIAVTGKVLIFSAGMIYAFGLSTESIYLLLNTSTKEVYGSDRTAEQIRFMPKLGVDDGAEFGRLIPNPLKVARIAANLSFGWIPGYPQALKGSRLENFVVWRDANFYLAIVGALAVSILQARAIRKVSIEIRKARLDAVRKYRVEDLSPKALTIAKIRAAEYQHAGVDGVVFDGLVIFASYAFEGATFLMGFSLGDSSFVFLLLNGVIQIFGFETCYRLTGLTDVDTEEDTANV